ncbi:MAG: hemerythrin domain-containing protein [Rhodospirillales bacterium]|jgi:hemerythrin|nr:hemerythrin domain-containing protein [Rhodospirillales bacterium]
MSADDSQLIWKDEFSVGHLGLDGEHRFFIELLNLLSLILAARASRQEILELLFLLESETDVHFQHEEEVLKLTGYPSVREHAETHRKLLEEIVKARLAVENRGEIDVSAETARLSALRQMLFEHILSEDMALRQHLG